MESQAKALAILEDLWWRNGISFWDYVALRTAIEGEDE